MFIYILYIKFKLSTIQRFCILNRRLRQNKTTFAIMEGYAASSEDALIDGLSFKLGNSASYITDRKSVTFWPSGSNIYKTSSGTKVIKFQLNSDGWCDPSTVRIMFNLVNNGDAVERLRPLQGAYSFFRRVRVSANGALLEDFDYNRTHQMFES